MLLGNHVTVTKQLEWIRTSVNIAMSKKFINDKVHPVNLSVLCLLVVLALYYYFIRFSRSIANLHWIGH
jgi:hypothetical protein